MGIEIGDEDNPRTMCVDFRKMLTKDPDNNNAEGSLKCTYHRMGLKWWFWHPTHNAWKSCSGSQCKAYTEAFRELIGLAALSVKDPDESHIACNFREMRMDNGGKFMSYGADLVVFRNGDGYLEWEETNIRM